MNNTTVKQREKRKLFHWIEMPNGTKIKLNKVGYGVYFKGGKPFVATTLNELKVKPNEK